jgi:hypothetical protein
MHSIVSYSYFKQVSIHLFTDILYRTNKALIKITEPLHDLRVLSVDQCESIGDEAIEQLVNQCPYIQELYLGSTHITDTAINLLATKLILLTHLFMSGCEYITEIGIKTLIRECKTLRHFDIKDCFNVVGDFDIIQQPDITPTNAEFRFLNANHRAFDVWNRSRSARIDNFVEEDADSWEDVDDDEEEDNDNNNPLTAYMEYEV